MAPHQTKGNDMRIDRQFNKRSAPLVELRHGFVDHGLHLGLGVRVRFFPVDNSIGCLAAHMTPHEALEMAEDLISHARKMLEAR